MLPESAHFEQDPEGQEEWTAYVRAHSPEIDPRDPEIQLLRRRTAILVSDPAASRGIGDVADAAESTGYVGAPVMVNGSVVGALFADRPFSGAAVDTVARDVGGLFAEGFGLALERTVLLGRMREQIGKIRK
jgi:hypothetical protein